MSTTDEKHSAFASYRRRLQLGNGAIWAITCVLVWYLIAHFLDSPDSHDIHVWSTAVFAFLSGWMLRGVQ
jgi:hypothetical protein